MGTRRGLKMAVQSAWTIYRHISAAFGLTAQKVLLAGGADH
ncbi:MAG: hypothetical protein WCK39_04070 [Methanomassiliicoccales archaeon]